MKKLENRSYTTGIGSLPHHNVDAALNFSFQLSLPFLPQIPIRNPWEYMIAQALEGMPGLLVEKEGVPVLDLNVWIGRSKAFNEKLEKAFSETTKKDAFDFFEPSPAASSCWQPFLWELEERKIAHAKIQIAGPLTSQWVLRVNDGSSIDKYPDISNQIFKLVLAKAISMCRHVRNTGAQPILYLDEPALYAITIPNPKHISGMQELKLLIQALKKEDVLVGIHCCSNTDWAQLMGFGIDILSIDCALSLGMLLETGEALKVFLQNGGRLSLGVIPTSLEGSTAIDMPALKGKVAETFSRYWPSDPNPILQNAIFTPACGLALKSPSDAESILAGLKAY